MADTTIPTTSSSGSQAATQNPQAAPAYNGAATQSAAVQPGTSTASLDTTTGGIPLGSNKVTTVNLGSAKASTATNSQAPASSSVNPAAVGFAILLFVVAAVLIFSTLRGAKNTTE